MYLEKVIIDYLQPDGTLVSWKIRPKEEADSVRVDNLRDIDSDSPAEGEVDAGGLRFYNSPSCEIEKNETQLRTISVTDNELVFQIEHLGIPLSKGRGVGGKYHLLLPVNFRLTEFAFLDPYDSQADRIRSLRDFESADELKNLDEFDYRIYWDPSCNTQFADMELRSPHGSFSFFASGKAEIYERNNGSKFVDSFESEGCVGKMLKYRMLDEAAKNSLSNDVISKINWLELKPNIFGLGINLNNIIEDSIDKFNEEFK